MSAWHAHCLRWLAGWHHTGITLPLSLTGTRQGLFTFTSTNWSAQTQAWPLISNAHHTLRFTTFLPRTAHYWWSIAIDITFLMYKYYDKWWQLTFFCNAGTWPVYWIGAPSTAKTKRVEKEVSSRVSKHSRTNHFQIDTKFTPWFQRSVHNIQY